MPFITLATSAIVIGLIDSSDPIAYTLIFKMFVTKKPIRNFLYFLIPYFFLVFMLGNIFFFLGTSIVEGLKGSFDQGEKILFYSLGGLLILIGLVRLIIPKKKKKKKKWKFKLEGIYCSLSALVLFVINIPLFILYASLIISIIKDGIAFPYSLIFISIYAFAVVSPYILVAILYKKYEDKIRKLLDKIFKFLGNKYVFGAIFILLGLYLILG